MSLIGAIRNPTTRDIHDDHKWPNPTYTYKGPNFKTSYRNVTMTGFIWDHYSWRIKVSELLYKAYWVFASPCTCGGCATVKARSVNIPVCLGNLKICCIENFLQSDDIWSDLGCCVSMHKCCCVQTHCAFPPSTSRGMPKFACFGQQCLVNDEGELQEDYAILQRASLCIYCLCCGIGLSDCNDPCCLNLLKCCCCQEHCFTTDACPHDGDCIFHHSKCWCCLHACTFPSCGGERDGIPGGACCGVVLCCPPASLTEMTPVNGAPTGAMLASAKTTEAHLYSQSAVHYHQEHQHVLTRSSLK